VVAVVRMGKPASGVARFGSEATVTEYLNVRGTDDHLSISGFIG